jgi:hypothetical protein
VDALLADLLEEVAPELDLEPGTRAAGELRHVALAGAAAGWLDAAWDGPAVHPEPLAAAGVLAGQAAVRAASTTMGWWRLAPAAAAAR